MVVEGALHRGAVGVGVQPQVVGDVNPLDDEYVVVRFHLADRLADQSPFACRDLTRLQRASEGARESAGGRRDDVVEGGGALGLGPGRHPVVLRDLRVHSERDGLGLPGEIREPQRPSDPFDAGARRVDDVAHGAHRTSPRWCPQTGSMLAAMARIAFVGLGTMGRHMAANLVAAGHELVACDVDPAPAAALGIPLVATPAAAAAGVDVAIMSLPSPAVVEEVALGPTGLLQGVRPGAVVVDMSTSPPSLARRLAAAFEAEGVDSLDAPVSGGPVGAEAATLAIMAGGRHEAFERVRPVLESMGSLVELVGGAGAGQAVKLCNNLIVGVTMAAMAEACALLEQEGIDPTQAYEVFTRSTSDSSVLRRRFPIGGVRPEHPASKGFEPLFRLDLLRKDLALALELAAEHGVSMHVTEVAAGAYDEALEAGLGGLDYSAVYRARRP